MCEWTSEPAVRDELRRIRQLLGREPGQLQRVRPARAPGRGLRDEGANISHGVRQVKLGHQAAAVAKTQLNRRGGRGFVDAPSARVVVVRRPVTHTRSFGF